MTQVYFSICIPQYNRTPFLLLALNTLAAQTYRNFEVCISDGGSTDGGAEAICAHLTSLGLPHVFRRSEANLRYDANLRAAIALSRGRYCLLMGNDDRLAEPTTLEILHALIEAHQPVAVAISNYLELSSGIAYRRMTHTAVLGSGPQLAAATFRHYAFVSGLVFEGEACRRIATDACDGSEMYQMYLGTRLITAGGRLLGIDRVAVHKDIQIPGEKVDSYRSAAPPDPCRLPMLRIAATVATGLHTASGLPASTRRGALAMVVRQLYAYTYPFWILEFRRVHGWRHALRFAWAIWPPRLIRGLDLALPAMLTTTLLYLAVVPLALTIPLRLFDALRPRLYAFAKRG